jgi:hypothetical protein
MFLLVVEQGRIFYFSLYVEVEFSYMATFYLPNIIYQF